jgi:hypothetical protein
MIRGIKNIHFIVKWILLAHVFETNISDYLGPQMKTTQRGSKQKHIDHFPNILMTLLMTPGL